MDVVINGERFSSADVQVTMLGRVLTGLKSINWKGSQNVDPVYVVGNTESVGHTKGQRKYDGSVVFLTEEYEGLKLAAGGKVFNLAPFPIVIVKEKNGVVIKETLTGVVFTEFSNGAEGSNTNALETPLSFWCSDIK